MRMKCRLQRISCQRYERSLPCTRPSKPVAVANSIAGRPRGSPERARHQPGWFWWEKRQAMKRTGRAARLSGRPVALLDRAFEFVGIDRADVFITNAVKHFKWEPRGKRRLHAKPSSREIAACRPWLDAELELIRPRVIVCLGATAAQALLGRDFRVT